MDTDVLVVGAGPTGLMLANQLARRGVTPLIIDRHSGPAQQTRAIGVQARTMEIYAWMGLIDEALARGAIAGGANLWANGEWKARIPVGDIGEDLSPYPFILMLGQDENERIMGEKLAALGVPIRWNTELTAFEQKGDHVAAQIRQPDGSVHTVTAAWVAGCDGSRSAVRELSRIGFPGAPYAHTFFVADTEATGSMRPGELNVYLWRDGFHLFFPMRGKDRWRVIGILPEALRAREQVTFDEVVPSIAREAGSRSRVQAMRLVLDLSHPSPRRRTLPRSALLPARRRRAHPQPGGRAGHEHRAAGRLQSRLEARAGGAGTRRRGAARHATSRSASRWRGACSRPPIARSRRSSRKAGCRGCCARRSSHASPRW